MNNLASLRFFLPETVLTCAVMAMFIQDLIVRHSPNRERLLMIESPWSYVPGLQRLVNRASSLYERHLCFLVRGRGLYFELEAVK